MTNENLAREVREARNAGIRALNSLRKAQGYLNSARGWGIFDMFGGGMITSMIKHSKLNEARMCIAQAREDLRIFQEELKDVQMPDIEVNGFLTFADFFFDGFLADIMVQQKINEARRQIEEACLKVEDIIRELQQIEAQIA